MKKIVFQSIMCIMLAGMYTTASGSNIKSLNVFSAKIESAIMKEYTHEDIVSFGKRSAAAVKNIPTAMSNINETIAKGSDYGIPIDEESIDGVNAVYSVAGGTVKRIGINEEIGKYVIVQHGDRSESIYGNLSNITCQLNEKVRHGEIIGEYTEIPEKNFYYALNYFD